MSRDDRIRRAAYEAEAATLPPVTDPGPLVGADLWRQVVTRAGGRCECLGCTARVHRAAEGRCQRTSRLHAVPREGPPGAISAMGLSAGELTALCDPCHAAALSKQHRAELAEARRALQEAPGLFDLDGAS